MSFPFPTSTIPQLPDNATPPNTVLFEISNSDVSENTSLQNIIDTAGLELKAEKGASNGYAGLDALQELLLQNFPSGSALQILRRNGTNTALEFISLPLTTKGDLYTYDTADQRLPVGTNGQILSANSAQATGLEWINQPASGITSINGDTTAAQIMAAGTGLQIAEAGATHTYSIDSTVATLLGVQTLENKTINATNNTITNLTNAALLAGVFSSITGLGTQSQTLNMGNNFIQAVLDPVNGSDAATKTYVDNLINGLSWKQPARLATTGNITLSGNQTIDGFLTVNGDRVLVKDQTSGQFNGVYTADSGAWTRTEDTDSEAELVNMSIYITEGTANEDTAWVLTTDPPIVVDTTVLDYAQVGAGSGNPLTTKGDIFGYDTGNARIPVGTDGLVLTANSAESLGVEYQTKEFTGTRTADIPMGGFDIDNVEEITLNNAGNFINSGAGGMQFGTAVNDGFFFAANFFTILEVSKGFANFNGQDATVMFELEANHSTPATGQVIAELNFIDDDSIASPTQYAGFEAKIFDPTNASEDGELFVNVRRAGTLIPYVSYNEGGLDVIKFGRNTNYDGFDLEGLATLTFDNTDNFITASGNMVMHLGSGSVFQIEFDGFTKAFSFDETEFGLDNTNIVDVFNVTLNEGGKLTVNSDASEAGFRDVGHTADPAGPAAGDLYYNTTSNTFRFYNGAIWGALGGGGAQTPITSDIDYDGFDIQDLSNIQFRNTTGAPAAGNNIFVTGGAMTFDVLGNTDTFQLRIGAGQALEYEFKNNTLDMFGNGLTNPGNFLDVNVNELLTWASVASAVNGFTITNAATGNDPIFAAGAFGDATVGMSIQGRSKGDIEFTNQAAQHTLRLIQNAGSGRNYITIENNITSAGPTISALGQTDTNIDINIIPLGAGLLNIVNTAMELNEIATPTAPGAALAQIYVKDVAARSHLFIQDDVGEVDLQLGASPLTTKGDIFGYDTGDARIPVGTNGQVLTANSAVALGVEWAAGGDVTGPGSAVDNELVRFNAATGKIIQGTTLPVIMDDAGQPTWPRAILFTNTTTQPSAALTWIESFFSDLQLNASTGNTVQISINAGIEYVFNATNLNFNRNDADQLGAVIFNTAGALTGGLATDPYLEYISATHLQLNVPSGDEFNISVNDVEEYSFSSSIFEGNGNIIRNFSGLEIQSLTGPQIVIERTDTTPSPADIVGNLRFRADRTASSSTDYAEIQTVVVDPAAASADGEMILKVIQANNLTEYISLNEGGSTSIHFKRPVQDFLMDLTTGSATIGQLEGLTFTDDATEIVSNSFIQRSNSHLIVNSPTGEDIELSINNLPELTIALNQLTINPGTDLLAGGDVVVSDRLQELKGPDVTGATTITVGDGNFFDITGSGTINHMTFTGWQSGSMVTLQFDAGATVNHNTGTNPANTVSFFLAGSVNQLWTAGSTLTVIYDGVVWREVARSLA